MIKMLVGGLLLTSITIAFLPATGVENNVYMDSGNCISSVDGNSSAVHWRDK